MEATKTAYEAAMGQTVKLNGSDVTVCSYEAESKSGSWERGFKWTYTTYGYLTRKRRLSTEYSFDHGVTWHDTRAEARKVKGKIKLAVRKSQEFAFDSIQQINKDHDPNYAWRP